MPYRLATPQHHKNKLGWIVGFEPTTSRATIWRSNHLSYTHRNLLLQNGAPEGIRTPDLRIRSPLLYPAELQAHINGAGDGNRTHAASLEGWSSTIELHPHLNPELFIYYFLTARYILTCSMGFVNMLFLFFIILPKRHV